MEKLISLYNAKKDFAFFNSSKKVSYSGDRVLLFSDKKDEVKSSSYNDFKKYYSDNQTAHLAGYFAYDLKNSFERLAEDEDFFISNPNIHFINFAKRENLKGDGAEKLGLNNYSPAEISYLKSNMSKAEYLSKVARIKEHIIAGDIYQANLTRKFYGEFKETPNSLEIYQRLNEISPAPYSCFLKFGDIEVISSSPEMFLKTDEHGHAVTCPIKGSAGAGQSAALSASAKDKAENLMITDLMRNDFARSCVAGSIKVEDLFGTHDFANVSHMVSTITGQLKEGEGALSLIKNCFPAGSMTGAPKIKAMEIISELEKHKRGIYSGAIGFFEPSADKAASELHASTSSDIACEFSVVIRTIVIQGNKFEFQVGGGIVYDSSPEAEWQETMTKASAIAKVLGVESDVEKL